MGIAKQTGLKIGKIKGHNLGVSGCKLLCQGLEVEFVAIKTEGNKSRLQK